MKEFGKLLRCHRKKSKLTQIQLADLAGVGKTVIFDIEHGKETVQFETFQKVCRVLNISIELQSPIMDYCIKEVANEKG
jgi:y4mF family transcriptional regulator